jgi:hypothetical protein
MLMKMLSSPQGGSSGTFRSSASVSVMPSGVGRGVEVMVVKVKLLTASDAVPCEWSLDADLVPCVTSQSTMSSKANTDAGSESAWLLEAASAASESSDASPHAAPSAPSTASALHEVRFICCLLSRS